MPRGLDPALRSLLLSLPPPKSTYVGEDGVEPWLVAKRTWLIDVPLGARGYVCADGMCRKNTLVFNFWNILAGILSNTNVGNMVDINGNWYTVRVQGQLQCGPWNGIAWGSNSSPTSFVQYNLYSLISSTTGPWSYTVTSNGPQFTTTVTINAAASEIAYQCCVYDTSGNIRVFMFARTTGSWAANSQVSYSILFTQPWVQPMGDIYNTYGSNAAQASTDISGNAITLMAGGQLPAGASYIVASPNTVTWAPQTYSLSGAFSLSTSWWLYNPRTSSSGAVVAIAVGTIAPSSNTTVNALALYTPVYTSSGTTDTVMTMLIPLSSPVTLYAGRTNTVFLRIGAM